MACGYYSCNFIDKRTNDPVLPTHKNITLDGKKIALIGVTIAAWIVGLGLVVFGLVQMFVGLGPS